ncbi:hypothetical protein EDD11_007926 [Mortierella claussenii]|nr:hypothetical protein EDD11_007926 [Mortierella claussenii]
MEQNHTRAGGVEAQLYGSYAHYRQPPVLSFRAFHNAHFSSAQRHAFFAHVNYPSRPDQGLYPWNGLPTALDTVIHQSNYHTSHADVAEQPSSNLGEVCPSDDVAIAEPEPAPVHPQLSKEAIEIFEFSRRFRQEKAAAASLEQARLKKRRIKRRKLTKLGFAVDEGDSGPEAGDSGGKERSKDLRKAVGDAIHEQDKADEEEEEDEWDADQDTAQQELPPIDVTFLNQRGHSLEKLRQGLYGSSSGTGAVNLLESLVNQTYEDSLGSRPLDLNNSGENKRHGPRGGRHQPSRPASQVVYWPGIPLRC